MLESAEIGQKLDKAKYEKILPELRKALIDTQYELAETERFSVVVVIAGMAGGGRSRAINQVGSWFDARLIEIYAQLTPTDEERQRPVMWRFWRALPPKGRTAVYFDDWYREPVIRNILGEITESQFAQRIAEINRFEKMLTDEGVLLLKLNLHLSKDQQRKRLKNLQSDPATRWRVTEWDRLLLKYYEGAKRVLEETIRLTSYGHAPWTIVDAADQRYSSVTIARAILQAVNRRLRAKPAAAKPAPVRKVKAEPAATPSGRTILSTLDLSRKLDDKDYERLIEKWQGRFATLIRRKTFRRHALVIAFEGSDAAGKGGSIRRVAQALDISQVRILPIAKPTDEEAARPYLWRFWRHIPRYGQVTIFDRTWYGRVLVERVENLCSEADWRRAYSEINDFESDLVAHGILVVKFWLQISKQEQLKRFRERERVGFKHFKITPEDWRNRGRWDDYQVAAAEMIQRTSTDLVPWTLVEAEDKLYERIKVLKTICRALEAGL
jgi:polyphosphate:AMP phosphotransferase